VKHSKFQCFKFINLSVQNLLQIDAIFHDGITFYDNTLCVHGGEVFTEFWGGRPEGKRPLGRPRGRWEDNIKLDLREIGIDEANWIQLAQDRVQ
jgi:hypothetical protein